jgi:predicted membrane-bound mannosyltransferase
MRTFLLIAALLGILVASAVGAASIWMRNAEIEVSMHGYIAMALGVIVSLALGIGLMALTFFSAKRGYDEIDIRED